MTYTTLEALRLAEEAFMKIADLGDFGKINPEVIAFETLYTMRAAGAQERAEQEPVASSIRGFSLWLDREAWGHVIDGLMLERERSAQRKAANPDSNSNYIANRCAELIAQIGEAATDIVQPVSQQPANRFTSDDVKVAFEDGYAARAQERECTNCGGTGDASGEYPGCACGVCGGAGHVEPAKQEPVAWPIDGDIAKRIADKQCVSYEVVQLIAREILPAKHGPVLWGDDKFAPHERPRKHPVRTKDLTDFEIDCIRFNLESGKTWIDFARAVIAKYKEKNK